MSNFKKYFWIVAAILLPTKVLGDTELPPQTPDGRFGTPCYVISGLGGEVCEVPFARLLATPERYDGKIIRVTGFLINIYGSPVLFANKSSFDSGSDIEGITLRGAKISKKIEKKINSGVWRVYVVGRFDAKFENEDKTYRLGMIKEIISVDTWQN